MTHRLLSFRKSCDTLIPRVTLIRGFCLHTKTHHKLKVQSFPLSAFFSRENEFWSQNRYRQPALSFSSCQKNYHPSTNRRRAVSEKFLEFHDRVCKQSDDYSMGLSEWENLENEILSETPSLEPGLDFSIMKSLKNKPGLSLSFLNYIRSKRQPNLPTLIAFFTNCAEKYEETVLKEFDLLKKSCDLKALYVRKNKIAEAIAKTREWKQSIDLLDFSLKGNNMQLINDAVTASSEVLKRCLKEKDFDSFFHVWNKFSHLADIEDFEVVGNMFFKLWEEDLIPFDMFLELLKLGEMPLQDGQYQEVLSYCNRQSQGTVTAQMARVGKKSVRCSVCDRKVPVHDPIEASTYEKMSKEIYNKMLIGKNIFRKTSPEELERFINFMKEQEYPFDFVIDGLNYILTRIPENRDKVLLQTLERLHTEGKRCLVITKGIIRFKKQYEKYASVFSLDIKTYDDCYMMLAATLSGPQCYVVTNDDFRDHIAVVDPSLRPYFLRWRDQRRIFHKNDLFFYPPKFKWITHESDVGWHIPCRKSLNINNAAVDKGHQSLNEFRTRAFICVRKLNYTPSPEVTQLKSLKINSLTKLKKETC